MHAQIRYLLALLIIGLLGGLGIQSSATAVGYYPQQDTLDEAIQAVLGNYPEATVGIAVRDPATGTRYDHQAEREFHAASTMKVPVMIEAFRRAEHGGFSLDDELTIENEFTSIVDGSTYSIDSDSDEAIYDHLGETMTIRHLAERMIQISSNLATNLLIEHLTPDSVQQTVERLGAGGMQVRRGVFDMPAFYRNINNTTTAAALATQLEALMQQEAVSSEADRAMIEILREQEFIDAIPAGLPEEVAVAHKTGSITEIHHDAAIVEPGEEAPYVLVLLTEGVESDDRSATLMAELANAVHRYLRDVP